MPTSAAARKKAGERTSEWTHDVLQSIPKSSCAYSTPEDENSCWRDERLALRKLVASCFCFANSSKPAALTSKHAPESAVILPLPALGIRGSPLRQVRKAFRGEPSRSPFRSRFFPDTRKPQGMPWHSTRDQRHLPLDRQQTPRACPAFLLAASQTPTFRRNSVLRRCYRRAPGSAWLLN